MSNEAISTIIVAFITLAGGVAASLIAKRTGERADLWRRVESVEDDLTEMRTKYELQSRQMTAVIGFVNAIGLWLFFGQRGPMPSPQDLIHDLIDMTIWSKIPTTAGKEPA